MNLFFHNPWGIYKYILGLIILFFMFGINFSIIYFVIKRNQFFTKKIIIAVLLSLIILGFWHNFAYREDGDAAIYLLITHSLVYDHDIDLKNNYINKDYHLWTPKEFTFKGVHGAYVNGRLISFHEIGLPLILMIPYLIGLRIGCILFQTLIAFGTFVLMYKLCLFYSNDKLKSLLTSCFFILTLPLVSYSHFNFSENLAAFIVLSLYLLIIYEKWFNFKRLFFIVLLGFLPVLGSKYSIIAFIIGLIFIFKHYKKKQFLIGLLIPLSAFLFMALINYLFFNGIFPWASRKLVGVKYDSLISFNIIPALLGLFLDQECGLFIFNPVLVIVLFNFRKLFYKYKYIFIIIILHIVGLSFWEKWSGITAGSPRFLVSLMPLIAPVFLENFSLLYNNEKYKIIIKFLIILTCIQTFLHLLFPFLHFGGNIGNGKMQLFDRLISSGFVDLSKFFPSYILWSVKNKITLATKICNIVFLFIFIRFIFKLKK